MILRGILLFLTLSTSLQAKELTVLISDWAPYNFKQNDKVVGISTDLVEAALNRSGLEYKILIYPFKRALYTVENTPNTLLFTVARINQRENRFKWIGPLYPRQVYLYKLKSRTDIQINSIKDIKRYRTGALLGGTVEQYFKTNNFQENDDYLITTNSAQLLKILLKQRVDLIPGDPLDLSYQIKQLGFELSELEKAYLLSNEGGYYIIANKATSNELVAKIQSSLDKLISEGFRDTIIKKYLFDSGK